MLRYTTDRARPGLVALYNIRPGNGVGQFLQPRAHTGHSHMRACRGSLWWSIRERCPSHLSCLYLIMSSSFGSAVASLTFSFVTLSFQEIPRILRCHLWCAAWVFSFVWLRLATALHCWATWRGLVLHKALFSLANWFSPCSIVCLVLRKRLVWSLK